MVVHTGKVVLSSWSAGIDKYTPFVVNHASGVMGALRWSIPIIPRTHPCRERGLRR
jgi:hypothetical protein